MGKTRQTGNIVSDGLVSVDIDNDQFKVGTGVTIYGSSGIISATSLYGDGSNITGISTLNIVNYSAGGGGISNVSEDTTPQLGGNLDLNSNNITGTGNIDITGTLDVSGIATFQNNVKLLDSDTLSFGTGEDFKIGHYFGTNAITMLSGNLSFTDSSSNERLKLTNNGDWEIKDNQATTRLKVVSTGATVTGDLYATNLYGDGSNITGISTLNIVNYSAGGGGGGSSEAFKTIAVSGQSDVVADTATDTLTLVGGTNIDITTNASTDTVTIASSAGIGLMSFARIADVKSAGSAGGVFSSGAWRTRTLNTELSDDDNIVSLSNNQFTLQAGKYRISWNCPANRVDVHISRLYNITSSSVVAEGTNAYSQDSAYYAQTSSTGTATVDISSATVFEIQHRCSASYAGGDGFGISGNIGQSQTIFTDIAIEKYSDIDPGGAAGSNGQIQYNNGSVFGGAAELYYDDSNDRLGIGISNPSETLHLQGDLSTQPSILIKRTYFSQDRELKLTHTGSNSLISDNTGGINFALSNMGATPTTQVSMQYSGVGIGTDTPGAKLDVDGTLKVSGTATFENNVQLLDSDELKLGSGSFDFTATHDGTNTNFYNYVGDLYIGTRGGEWTGDDIIIESADDFEVRLNASTNPGSGTTAIYATGGGSVKLNHNGSTKFETTSTGVTVTGNIAVSGTVDGRDVANDGTKLDTIATNATAYSNSDVDSHLNQSNPTSGYVLSWNGSDYAWVAQSGGGGGGGTSSLWTSTGYTGIGTSSAVGIGTKIEIIPYDDQDGGTLSFEGSAGNLFSVTNNLSSGSIFAVNDISGSPSIDVNADGTVLVAPYSATEKVGIGTVTPAYKLHVVGDTNIDGTFTVNGSAVSGGGAQEAFKTIAVSGQSDVVADAAADTLTLIAGSNMTITTNATNDEITFAASGGGSSLWTSTGYTGIGTSSAVGIGTKIEIVPYDDQDGGTLSFEGSAGNLLSITNNLSSGSIFAVNDISGSPSIDVNADGTVSLNGTVEINGAAPATTGKAIAMAMVFG